MYPLSDKDLDRLSREAAEQFAVEPHASDWDQLASKLDKELPVQKDEKKRRALWLLLVLLLSCGGGLLWLLSGNGTVNNTVATTTPSQETVTKNSTSKETTSTTENTISTVDKDSNKSTTTNTTVAGPNTTSTETKENNTNNGNSTKNTVTSTTSTESPSIAVTTDQTTKARSQKELVAGTQTKKSVAKNKASYSPSALLANNSSTRAKKNNKNTSAVTNKKDIAVDNTSSTAAVVADAKTNDINTSVTPATNKTNDDKTAVAVVPTITTDKPVLTNKTTDTAAINSTASANKKAPAKKGTPSQRGLSFGVTAGFDYSRINKTGDKSPGYNFGLQVSYDLSKRWSFNTGFILTKKNYTAKGSDFHPPKHYWTTYIALNDVEGNCQMWDIPLNIRYNLTTTKTKWFVSSGLSTYIMRKQDYNYYYTVNSLPREKAWSLNSQTNYWFNVLNISAGMEKQLNRSWTIQAEPFVKAPLKGVGFGNMSINSYGVLATLKFHPVFKH